MKRVLPLLFCIVISFSASAQVAPFITATWNQTCYYNDSCPTVGSGGSCGRAYTGCNATAMGMNTTDLTPGIYFLHTETTTVKFIRQ